MSSSGSVDGVSLNKTIFPRETNRQWAVSQFVGCLAGFPGQRPIVNRPVMKQFPIFHETCPVPDESVKCPGESTGKWSYVP